jgi:hypothetical protein
MHHSTCMLNFKTLIEELNMFEKNSFTKTQNLQANTLHKYSNLRKQLKLLEFIKSPSYKSEKFTKNQH